MARLSENFIHLKSQLGFNNPQIETTWFSLREEHFRILMKATSNPKWQDVLAEHVVANLWDLPEFRRYCKPFDTEDIAQPAIVIPFETTITSGLNLFGRPRGRDPFYEPGNFATKIRSVGVWFTSYSTDIMSRTPRVYLIPVGKDVLRTPDGPVEETRSWQVVEQSIPEPFSVSPVDLPSNNWKQWIPIEYMDDEFATVRRYVRFRAYPEHGWDPAILPFQETYDSRLIGRSVWNTRWLLIIPGESIWGIDPHEGVERFIHGAEIPGGHGERTGIGVTDIKFFFKTYAYSGN
jgi:hypothetical protein